jgi:fatty acid desaturase
LPPLTIAAGTQAYSQLKSEVTRAGILDRAYLFYAGLIAFGFVGYVASVAAIIAFDHWLLLGLACLGFSFFSVQMAGLMHDSGHRAVFASIRNNDILGYICAGTLAMVFDNWKTRHNMHHAHPNQEGLDPDVEIPFIATNAESYLKKRGFQRWLVKYQALYYYPLGSIVSFSNRLGTLTYFLGNRSAGDWWKVSLYVIGALFLFVAPFIAFSFEKALFVFVLVHVSTGIYLANCFAPNHKGMPMVAAGLSFLEQQVITSRNVRGGFFTDLMLVGLNHQTEHHLFPYCPRNKLGLLQPYVERTCEGLGIQFTEVGLVETNRILLRELRNVPRAGRLMLPQGEFAGAD